MFHFGRERSQAQSLMKTHVKILKWYIIIPYVFIRKVSRGLLKYISKYTSDNTFGQKRHKKGAMEVTRLELEDKNITLISVLSLA